MHPGTADIDPQFDTGKMTPLARKYYESVFLPRYIELQQEIETTPLAVLVWGPGKGPGDPYSSSIHEKRMAVRNALLADGYAAIFSEDIDKDSPSKLESLKTREMAQSLVADFIVVIVGSAGSIAEVHDFGAFPYDIGSKMLIFVDSRHKDSYSFAGVLKELNDLYGNVGEFEYPKDIDECHLLGKIQQRLKILRLAKWRTHLR
jgi:hypothetical protein